MEEENKYYTPEIEEFYIGFEYEIKVKSNPLMPIDGEGWMQTSYPDPFIGESINRIKDLSSFRVKYLDKTDIESLGWCYSALSGNFFLVNSFTDQDYSGVWLKNIKENIYQINNCNDPIRHRTIFEGTIKNKSELKKLMKQLGI